MRRKSRAALTLALSQRQRKAQRLLLDFNALIKTRDAPALFFTVCDGEFPFLFVGNHSGVFVAEGGDLKIVSVGIEEIDAAFARWAQTVGGAEIAERSTLQFGNAFEHHVIVVLADIECYMAGAALLFGAL